MSAYEFDNEREAYLVPASDLAILFWMLEELYNGGSWRRMQQDVPNIGEVWDRVGECVSL
jgi:hypothetical protein